MAGGPQSRTAASLQGGFVLQAPDVLSYSGGEKAGGGPGHSPDGASVSAGA